MNIEHAHREWLIKRGISTATQQMFNIHTSTPDNKIVIPIMSTGGDFLFNKYRRSPFTESGPKYTYDKGARAAIFAADKIKDHSVIVIAEGELDALALWSSNISAVSTTGGASTFLEEWVPLFKNKDTVICYDNDEAGAHGAVRVLKLLPASRVAILPDTAGVKDTTDYIMRGGDIHEFIQGARHYTSLSDVEEDMRRRQSQWLPTLFHAAYIEEHERSIRQLRKESFTPQHDRTDIENARAYPIPNLVKIPSNGKIKCIWHQDDTPSLHYYKKSNTMFCFGCAKSADAIDIYRHIHKCSFREAVRALSSSNV